MIKKVKSWILDNPQFEFVVGTYGNQVRRLSDGIFFKTSYPYLYEDGIKHTDGTSVSIFYIRAFHSVSLKYLTFEITKSSIENGFEGKCDIENLKYDKSGPLEIIGLKNLSKIEVKNY